MATNTTNIDYSTIPQNSYASFDAMSLRNLIIERLNQQGTFTDQNYIGSNLAAIIDIIAYSFNTLMFYLNRTSNETMFTEAQLNENINRIVKLLDYKPVGYQTSTLSFGVSANTTNLTDRYYLLPRYSYIMVGGIPFSFAEDITFAVNPLATNAIIELAEISNNKLLYQGIFRESPVFTASGAENEILTLNITDKTIDHFNIHVYVKELNTNLWRQYTEVSNLYTESTYSRSFEKRLNFNQLYEITFGNNIGGRKLETGDQIVIFYLQSLGEQGIIGPNILNTTPSLQKSIYTSSAFSDIFSDTKQDLTSTVLTNDSIKFLSFENTAGSTLTKNIEDADSIRENAPLGFKSQYRLVTEDDYANYIKINFSNFVSDVKIFNNWDYTSRYLKYFNDIQLNSTIFQQIALNQVLYSDACNFNNVYICAIPKTSLGSSVKYLMPSQKEIILNSLNPVKVLTSEVTFCDPIYKAVSFGFEKDGEIYPDEADLYRIEVTKLPYTNRTNQSIIADIVDTLQQFFEPTANKLGTILGYSKLVSSLLDVEGVKSFKTINVEQDTHYDGISFMMWNPTYPSLDNRTITSNLVLEPFEFFYYYNLQNISQQITIAT